MTIIAHVALLLVTLGCHERNLDAKDPVKSFSFAKEPYDDGHYEQALSRLQEFKATFPYSRYATESELLIADSLYKLRRFPESVASYEQFAKLHPKHHKRPLALFRVGMAQWEEAPTAVDREQDLTAEAVAAWQILVDQYPTDSLANEARGLMKQGERRIAEAAVFVAKFYCRQANWPACAYRHLKVIEAYAEKVLHQDLVAQSLTAASEALDKVADARRRARPSIKERKGETERDDANFFFAKFSAAELAQKAKKLANDAQMFKNLSRKHQS